jgi:hypothetical protein
MNIPDNIIKQKLHNVYFIWGSGKTTAANELSDKYGFYVYRTDNERAKHAKNADPQFQPALCRDVPDIWALDPKDALQWESEIVRDFTPMVIIDLIQLASQYTRVICEGDIEIDSIINVITNVVTISNYGRSYDFFDRPGQKHRLDEIRSRDISEEEKEKLIRNAYRIVGVEDEGKSESNRESPRETTQYGVKQIIRDDNSTIEQTAAMIAEYFGLTNRK